MTTEALVTKEREIELPSTPPLKHLTSNELLLAGVTSVVNIMLMFVAAAIATNVDFGDLNNDDIDTEEELISLHDSILNNEGSLLLSVLLCWVSVPFGLIHIHYVESIIVSLFAAIVNVPYDRMHFVKLLGRMYYLCYFFYTLLCGAISGIFLFLAVYYDWEFIDIGNNTSYIGYYIQYSFILAASICGLTAFLFLGFAISIPFLLLLYRNMHGIIGNLCCFCNMGCNDLFFNFLLAVFISLIYFCGIISTFGWQYNGYWSIDGGSHDMSCLFMYFVTIILSIWFIYLSKRINFVNQIIDDINNRSEYSIIVNDDIDDHNKNNDNTSVNTDTSSINANTSTNAQTNDKS